MAEPKRPTMEATTPMGGVFSNFSGTELPPELWEDLRRAFEPKYELRGILGRGGMGIVLDAYDPVLERPLAIKILIPDALREDSTARERLLREARAAATLSHPNVVGVFGVGETPQLRAPFILMQRVQGVTLDLLSATEKRLDVSAALGVLGDVAEALTAAHARGLVHRDLKPSNVMVEDQSRRAVVLDFGISQWSPTVGRQEAKLTGTGMYIGTPLYMSPEQASGKPATEKSDIYSLGCMMYEVLAGRRVFDGESAMAVMAAHIKDNPVSLAKLRADLPASLVEAVMECLAKNPSARPTADQLRRRCAPLPAHHPWVTAEARGLASRLRGGAILGIVAGILLGLNVVFLASTTEEGSTVALILSSFGIAATLIYLLMLERFWGKVRNLADLPKVLIALAGERSADIRAIVERRMEFASVDATVAQRELAWTEAVGAAFLLAGPATLLLAGLCALSGIGATISWKLMSLLVMSPVLLWLGLEVVYWRRAVRRKGGGGLPRSEAGGASTLVALRDWAGRHVATFGPTVRPARSIAARGLFTSVALVGMAAALWLGLIQGVGTFEYRGSFSNTRVKYEAARPLFAQALVPTQSLFGEDADRAWAVVQGGGLSGNDPSLIAPQIAPPPDWGPEARRVTGLPLLAMHATFRGLTSAQRDYLRAVVNHEDVLALRRAVRAGSPRHWERVADTLLGSSANSFHLAPIPKFSGGKAALGSLAIEAALLVDAGRPDSAEALLREGLAFAAIQERAAHTLIETLIASVEALMIGPVLGELYDEGGQYRKKEALSPLTPLPTSTELAQLIEGIDRTNGGAAAGINQEILDTMNSRGQRWEMLSYQTLLSCGRPRSLWTGHDALQDSAMTYAMRGLARDRPDSIIVSAMVRTLDVLGNHPIDWQERAAGVWHAHLYEWLRRAAAALGKRRLAGCIAVAAGA